MASHGGDRKGAGRKPRAGTPAKYVAQVPLTEAEHAEMLDAAGDRPLAAWIREAALAWGRTQ